MLRLFLAASLAACSGGGGDGKMQVDAGEDGSGDSTGDGGEGGHDDTGGDDDADGDPEEDAGVDAGGTFDPEKCGNGEADPGEACDDGNDRAGDGCDKVCQVETGYTCPVPGGACEECGNGVKESSESCDDGNRTKGDGCDASCQIEDGNWACPLPGEACELCGDGVVDPNERCDEGASADGAGCTDDCRGIEENYHCFAAGEECVLCGNGVKESGEACDDGNYDTGDGCVPTCIAVEAGWVCPEGGGACTLCGDGVLAPGLEECDDGNFQDGDGCSTSCKLDDGAVCLEVGVLCSVCGNGYREPVLIDDQGTEDPADDVITLEECDDGNLTANDGCSEACLKDPAFTCPLAGHECNDCGNGVVEGFERCDEGELSDGVGCSADCYATDANYNCFEGGEPCVLCGNGVVEAGESCDDGNTSGGDGCARDCRSIESGFNCTNAGGTTDCSKCGDGLKELAEACDDRNTEDDDGCAADCSAVEDGYNCFYPGFPCVACGNGELEPGEQCDEGTFNTAGCDDATCQIVDPWLCPLEGQPCQLCGDGQVDTLETCDDENNESGDGCSSTCDLEPGWTCEGDQCLASACGDGYRAGEEECDDGNALSGDGCSTVCKVDAGYVCNDAGCRRTVCGDTVVEGAEECDDGDTDAADGCDASCQLEAGYKCPDPGQPCAVTTCGDGYVEGTEECDDGGAGTPGCDANCKLEPGYACPATERECNGGDNDGQSCTSELSCPGGDCSRVSEACHETVCEDGIVEGSEACDDGGAAGVCRGGTSFGAACATDAECAGGGVCVDGCSDSCTVNPFYECEGEPSVCKPILEFVAVRRFNVSSVSPDGLVYDPLRRSFAGHKQSLSSGVKAIELCLDGSVINPNDTAAGPNGTIYRADGTNEAIAADYRLPPKPIASGTLLEAAYDPFTGRYLFLSSDSGIVLTEVPLCTVEDCPAGTYFRPGVDDVSKYQVKLTGVSGAQGLTVGEDGNLYVTNDANDTVAVFSRRRNGDAIVVPDCVATPEANCTSFETTASSQFSAPVAGSEVLDAIFTVPGEEMIGLFNRYSGATTYTGRDELEGTTYTTQQFFSFYQPSLGTDPPLYGRSALPGLLFRLGGIGQSYTKYAQSAETASDGGSFIICPQNPSEDCQLFARTCASDEDCSAVVPGTTCNLSAPVPYCSSPGEARDDRAEVERSSADNVIDVLANDSRSESSCVDPVRKVVSLTGADATGSTITTTNGATVTITNEGADVAYSAPAEACGFLDSFTYTANLGGGVLREATVRVVVKCVCGDGVKDKNEQCDLGDDNGPLPSRCSDACSINVVCGDTIVDPGEECDNGACSGGPTPGATCTSDEQCGEGGSCAAVAPASGDGCSAICTLESACGDGVVEGVEQCEPGLSPEGTCTDTCTIPYCGDTRIDVALGEQCDEGPNNGGMSCTLGCTVVTQCGNGKLELGEQCDDGGVLGGDGCSAQCTIEGQCGNGAIESTEECDPNAAATQCGGMAACNNRCLCENYCGDGRIGGTEQCDDGNASTGDGCRPNCTLEVCGDALVDQPNEQCDDGNTSTADKCANDCTVISLCGDGVLDPGEDCDDGKNVSGDGCSSTCKSEATVCGNGVKEYTEQCDDGNTSAGDGCSSTCKIEGAVCGNSKVETGESCDDGNKVSGDGCSASCQSETIL